MKKHLLAVAVATAIAAPAMAQNVTIGGTLDASVVSKTAAKPVTAATADTYRADGSRSTASPSQTTSVTAQDNSFWSTSNINLKGTEDLGGGMKAFFHIEGAIATDTGDSALANRVSQVGISGAFGTATFGRGSTAMNDLSTSAGHGLGNFVNLPFTTTARPNNAVNYITPTFNGMNARVTFAPGEAVDDTNNGDYQAVSFHGKVGAFSFGVAQASEKEQRSASGGRVFWFNADNASAGAGTAVRTAAADTTTGLFDTTNITTGFGSDVLDGTNVLSISQRTMATNAKKKDTIVAVAYDFGAVKLTGQYLRNKSDGEIGRGAGIESVDRKVTAIGLIAPMGAATLFANYQNHDRTSDRRSGSTDGTAALNTLGAARTTDENSQFTVGALYALSKRTSAYIVHQNVDNEAGSNYKSGVNGKDAQVTAIGVRHTF